VKKEMVPIQLTVLVKTKMTFAQDAFLLQAQELQSIKKNKKQPTLPTNADLVLPMLSIMPNLEHNAINVQIQILMLMIINKNLRDAKLAMLNLSLERKNHQLITRKKVVLTKKLGLNPT
jgi:hypothetical protein